eukprot:2650838-Pyramimonas_sp.AAC.1
MGPAPYGRRSVLRVPLRAAGAAICCPSGVCPPASERLANAATAVPAAGAAKKDLPFARRHVQRRR